MILSVTYNLEFYHAISSFTIDVMFYQVELLLFYNVQTTNWHLLAKYEIYSR